MNLTTLQEAILYFSDIQTCIDYMVKRRWPEGVECPSCGSKNVTYLPTRKLFQCKARHAKRQFSVKVGTVMEDSPIRLDKWLLVTWMLVNCRNGISSHEVARTIGITQKSAWFMLHRLRASMRVETAVKLFGDVEADETYVGGKSRNMHVAKRKLRIRSGGVHDKTPVMGMLARGGEVRAMVIKSHKRPHLYAELQKHVEPGSTLFTDDLHSYRRLKGYDHHFVDHKTKFVSGIIHTNGLENFWSCLKRSLKGTYISVTPSHLTRYVDEQVFRFNHRTNHTEEMRFGAVLSGIPGKRLTYKELIAREA